MKTNNFKFNQIQNYLKKKGFIISKKKPNPFSNKDLSNIYVTILSSFLSFEARVSLKAVADINGAYTKCTSFAVEAE